MAQGPDAKEVMPKAYQRQGGAKHSLDFVVNDDPEVVVTIDPDDGSSFVIIGIPCSSPEAADDLADEIRQRRGHFVFNSYGTKIGAKIH